MIDPNTIVFFIPFSVPLHEIKFTVDGLKNWLNQKKIKEVPYLCDSVTQQWMFWVHREKKSNILFLKLSVLILMVRWVFEFPVVSIISKENFLKFWMFVFFFCHLWVCSDSPPVFSVKVFWSDCASWQWGETNFTLISRPQRPRAQNKQDL